MKLFIQKRMEDLHPDDITRLVGVLLEGGLLVAPTDTVYGIIGRAFQRETFIRLDEIKGERSLPYVLVYGSVAELFKDFNQFDPFRKRLLRAALPGPFTFLLPSEGGLSTGFRSEDSGVGVRVPTDPLYPRLATEVRGPLWATSANHAGEPAPMSFADVSPELLSQVDAALDAGPTPFGAASTVLDLRGGEPVVLRRGAGLNKVKELAELWKRPLSVLLVCTGNICRSPYAAGALRKDLSERGVTDVVVDSAGTNPYPVPGVVPEMGELALQRGVDLSRHISAPVTSANVEAADLILCAEPFHIKFVAELQPEAADKLYLMGETVDLDEIPDPFNDTTVPHGEVAETLDAAMSRWAERLAGFIQERGGVKDSAGGGRG